MPGGLSWRSRGGEPGGGGCGRGRTPGGSCEGGLGRERGGEGKKWDGVGYHMGGVLGQACLL